MTVSLVSGAGGPLVLEVRQFDGGPLVNLDSLPTITIQNLQNGSFSALFTASSRRFPLLPDVPTASEAGLSGFNVVFHTGFWTAPGTPAAVIKRLSTEITAAVRLPEVVDAIRKTGTDTSGTTPEEQMRNLDEEIKFWTEATRLANYQPQ